jgi:hypothetical protein
LTVIEKADVYEFGKIVRKLPEAEDVLQCSERLFPAISDHSTYGYLPYILEQQHLCHRFVAT